MSLGKAYTVEHQVKRMEIVSKEDKDLKQSAKNDLQREKMENDDTKQEGKEEEIFEDVGGIQFEVFSRFNDEVHISSKQKYPENFDASNYDTRLLKVAPTQSH